MLRPGGVFVALWHVFATPDAIAEALADTYRQVAPEASFRVGHSKQDALAAYQAGCDRTTDALVATGEFAADAQRWSASWNRTYSTAEYLDLILTMSPLALLSAEQVTGLLAGVGAAVDAAGGSFTSHYETLAVVAIRN